MKNKTSSIAKFLRRMRAKNDERLFPKKNTPNPEKFSHLSFESDMLSKALFARQKVAAGRTKKA